MASDSKRPRLSRRGSSMNIASNQHSLKITPPPPNHPFCDAPFMLQVYLVDDAGDLVCGRTTPLTVTLEYAEKPPVPAPPHCMVLEPAAPVVDENGQCAISVRMTECSAAHTNRPFQIRVAPAGPPPPAGADGEEPAVVAEVVTDPLVVVQHALELAPAEDWQDIWYKDEGGRDKCIELSLSLVDASGSLVRSSQLPLRVTLLYEDGGKVGRQDVLRVAPDSDRTVRDNGRALLRVRIEDVSKNHQGQKFRLKVGADTQIAPLRSDVASGLSQAVIVRSKRNKRNRSKQAAQAAAGAAPAPRLAPMMQMQPNPAPAPAAMAVPPTAALSGSAGTAMTGVINWAGAVVQGLHQLEWQHVGFETGANGQPDEQRPIYSWRYKDVMTFTTAQHAPRCALASILTTYGNETMVHLHTLLKHVEGGGGAAAPAAAAAAAAPAPAAPAAPAPAPAPSMVPVKAPAANRRRGPPRSATAPPAPAPAPPLDDLPPPGPPGGMGGLFRQQSELGIGPGVGAFQGAAAAQIPDLQLQAAADESESRVTIVLAKTYHHESLGPIGFPAFSQDHEVLGFYREEQSESLGGEPTKTEVTFITRGQLPQIDDAHVTGLVAHLDREIANASKSVHTLEAANNDPVKLKEDAIMYSWSKAISNDLSSFGGADDLFL